MARTVRTARTGASRSAPGAAGQTQGTLGGRAVSAAGSAKGRAAVLGDEIYLWILVLVEVAAIAWLRASFSRYHGG